MKMELTFWEWTQRQGYSLADLATKLGYSAEHISRIKNGHVPVTTPFIARCVFIFGDEVRAFFLSQVSANTDIISVCPEETA